MQQTLPLHRPDTDLGRPHSCSCTLADASNNIAPNRRQALGIFTALLASTGSSWAQNPDGLLSPQAIGTTSASSSSSTGGTSAGGDPMDGLYASTGRSVATRTVDQIDTLALNLVGMQTTAKTIKQANDQREARLRGLIEDRDSKLNEFRAGLFCSGCGRTKSEILKKGEQFPHPGQTIVEPTSDQIRAKERELEGPIDSLKRDINHALDQLKDLRKQRDEALEQISYGLMFWQTGYSYQVTVLQLKLQMAERNYNAKVQDISKLITQLEHEVFMAQQRAKRDKATTPPTPPTANNEGKSIAEIQADIKLWSTKLKDAERAYQKDKRVLDSDLQEARQRSTQDEAKLTASLTRPELVTILTVVPKAAQLSPYSRPDELGLKFREGNFNLANAQEVRPGVQKFIQEFRDLTNVAIATGATLGATPNVTPRLPPRPEPTPTSPQGNSPSGTAVPRQLLNLP